MGMDDGELTPDRRLAVVRENTAFTTARIYDVATGQIRATVSPQQGTFSGACQDAVAVTNTRAVVIGSCAMILDLTNLANPLLAAHNIGFQSRDVVITPDGTLAIIRGGKSIANYPGGSFVLDLSNGALLASHPGEAGDVNNTTHTYDVDSVVTTNSYAVCTSILTPGPAARTRVTIWDLHPAGGGAPVVAYETLSLGGPVDQAGAPHDVTLTPDGQYAAVRSEYSVGLYHLGGAAPSRVWHKRLWNHPGPMGFTSMDSIEATNTRIATASRYTGWTAYGAQVDVFDIAGNHWVDRIRGDPHDLVITPDSSKLVVRTHLATYMYDLANLPGSLRIEPTSRHEMASTHTYYGAGYDSLQTTNTRLVAVARVNVSASVRIFNIASVQLQLVASFVLPEKPVDVDLSPDGHWMGVSGTSYVQLYDFTAATQVLNYDPSVDLVGWFPWCDGIEVENDFALAWGYNDAQGGWLSLFDL
jgi:hypothetical protein